MPELRLLHSEFFSNEIMPICLVLRSGWKSVKKFVKINILTSSLLQKNYPKMLVLWYNRPTVVEWKASSFVAGKRCAPKYKLTCPYQQTCQVDLNITVFLARTITVSTNQLGGLHCKFPFSLSLFPFNF